MAKNASFVFDKLVEIRSIVDELFAVNCPSESLNQELRNIEMSCFRASAHLNRMIHKNLLDKIEL